MKDEERDIMLDSNLVKGRWKEYFSELLNQPDPPNAVLKNCTIAEEERDGTDEELMGPTAEEVTKWLKNSKAAGSDGKMAEWISVRVEQ